MQRRSLEITFNRLLLVEYSGVVRIVVELEGFLPEFCEVGELSVVDIPVEDPSDDLSEGYETHGLGDHQYGTPGNLIYRYHRL